MLINKKMVPLCFVYFAFAMLQHLFTLDYSNECKKEKKQEKKIAASIYFQLDTQKWCNRQKIPHNLSCFLHLPLYPTQDAQYCVAYDSLF